MITNEGDIETDFASDYRLPSFSTGLGDGFDMASFDSNAQRRYREAFEIPTTPEPAHFDSRGTSPLLPQDTLRKIYAIQHTQGCSSPDDPPSRPNSIVSTAFALNLRSRPPTFFDDLPKNSAHTPPLDGIPLPLTTDLADRSYFPRRLPSESIDAAGTSQNRRPSIQPSLPVGPETDAGTPFERSTGSMEANRALDAFESGLLSGNTTSIALSRSTPTTEAFSTLLGPNLDTPPLPKTPEYDQLRDRGKPDFPQSPTVLLSARPLSSILP